MHLDTLILQSGTWSQTGGPGGGGGPLTSVQSFMDLSVLKEEQVGDGHAALS